MFSPADELAAEKLGGKNVKNPESIIRKLQNLLVDIGDGTPSIADINQQLKNLRTGASNNNDDIKTLNKTVTFYSTLNEHPSEVTAPYSYIDSKGVDQQNIQFNQIVGGEYAEREENKNKSASICLSRSAYLSPVAREVDKVETFLNYMPSIVLSRCIPYLEMEFVFDRPNIQAPNTLTTAGLLKFLLGGAQISENETANSAMYKGRNNIKPVEGNIREFTSAGMELFTAPQTLVNMDPVSGANRYIPVIDPTRPFASLESVTITVTPTTGIMSYKSAQAVIKLFDRSRLAEFADLIQPTTYGRTTIWLTYGWRHQQDESDKVVEAYAEFINKKMLIREAYGIVNSSYSFDTSGVVTITLQLFTKSVLQLKEITLADDGGFLQLAKKQEDLARAIDEIRTTFNLEQPKGVNKEIRSFTVLNAAAGNSYPDLDRNTVETAINELNTTLKNRTKTNDPANQGSLDATKIDTLINGLKEFYFGTDKKQGYDHKNKKQFYFQAKVDAEASKVIKKKFEELQFGADPFFLYEEKQSQLMEEFGYPAGTQFPFFEEMKKYSKSQLDPTLAQQFNFKVKNKIVSFGKLFATFVVPAVMATDTCDECQIYFYNINEIAGKASGTNLAEFPIDLPEFLYDYKEEIKTASAITLEKFVQLVVNSQITDFAAIPYGFRSQGIFKKERSKENGNFEIDDKQQEKYVLLTTELNNGRGSFQFPQVEIYVEMCYKRPSADVLENLRYSNVLTNPYGPSDYRILKIHVYDKSLNPYPEAAKILKDGTNGIFTYTTEYDQFNPFVSQMKKGEVEIPSGVRDITSETPSGGSRRGIEIKLTGDYNDREKIRHAVTRMVPTLIPGMNTSGIIEASVSTKNDPTLSSAQMMGLNSGRSTQANPRGSGIGNLPLKVIPASLTMRTIGCPIISYSQMFFVDMNTGTTIDNIYGISGITHQLQPGKFDTSLQFAFYDAYGKYEPPVTVIDKVYATAEKVNSQ